MNFFAHTEETAEAHDQRTPALRVDMRARAVACQQVFFDMQFDNVHLEAVGAHVFSEGAAVVYDALHLHGAFQHPRRRDHLRCGRRETRRTEFVRFVAIAPL